MQLVDVMSDVRNIIKDIILDNSKIDVRDNISDNVWRNVRIDVRGNIWINVNNNVNIHSCTSKQLEDAYSVLKSCLSDNQYYL